MISKRRLAKGKVRVTFTMPPIEGVHQLHIVGDFNNWSVTATPLAQDADGSWSVALTLDGDREYQYRYFANDDDWHNDWAADDYVTNEFGSENSVVNLKALANGERPAPRKRTSAKKKL